MNTSWKNKDGCIDHCAFVSERIIRIDAAGDEIYPDRKNISLADVGRSYIGKEVAWGEFANSEDVGETLAFGWSLTDVFPISYKHSHTTSFYRNFDLSGQHRVLPKSLDHIGSDTTLTTDWWGKWACSWCNNSYICWETLESWHSYGCKHAPPTQIPLQTNYTPSWQQSKASA